MLSREFALKNIFERHGSDAIYVTSTGYISRATYFLYSNNKNIFYMQGSMGLAPSIGLGMALNTKKQIVVISGDAALLMHLGIIHTIKDAALSNLYIYVLDNGCHESVGMQSCSALLDEYIGITEIIKISCDGKPPRVGIGFEENTKNIMELLC